MAGPQQAHQFPADDGFTTLPFTETVVFGVWEPWYLPLTEDLLPEAISRPYYGTGEVALLTPTVEHDDIIGVPRESYRPQTPPAWDVPELEESVFIYEPILLTWPSTYDVPHRYRPRASSAPATPSAHSLSSPPSPPLEPLPPPSPLRRVQATRGMSRRHLHAAPPTAASPPPPPPSPPPPRASPPPLDMLRPASPLRRVQAQRGFSRAYLHAAGPTPPLPPHSPPGQPGATAQQEAPPTRPPARAGSPSSSEESDAIITPSTSMRLNPRAPPFRSLYADDQGFAPPPTPADVTDRGEGSSTDRLGPIMPTIAQCLFVASLENALRKLEMLPDRR